MKIGILIDVFYQSNGGPKVCTYGLIKKLLKIDNENEYFLINFKKLSFDLPKNFKQIIIPSFGNCERDALRKIFLLPLFLKPRKFDIFHSILQFGMFWAKIGKKNILSLPDIIPVLHPEFYDSYNYFSFKYILQKFIKNIDIILTVSKNSKIDIINFLRIPEEKIKVIYPGIDEIFTPIKNAKNLLFKKYKIDFPFILHVTMNEKRTNLITLLNAFSLLKKQNKIYHKLIILGQIKEKEKLYFLLKKLNLLNDVLVVGFIPREDQPIFYSAADLFISVTYYEGFGLPISEALSCGCPVITSNASSLPEVVGKGGILLNPSDTSSICNHILDLIENKNKRKQIAEEGLKIAKKFNWFKAAESTLKIYKELNVI
jgi:glycosyltransferase involved in cell wall biosynthesis